jgi:hypothetical protein
VQVATGDIALAERQAVSALEEKSSLAFVDPAQQRSVSKTLATIRRTQSRPEQHMQSPCPEFRHTPERRSRSFLFFCRGFSEKV